MPSLTNDSPEARASRAGCHAVAHSNIALAKYWGKRDVALNLPDVPSLSLTLAALSTTTFVRFDPDAGADRAVLNGVQAEGATLAKVSGLLDRVRADAGLEWRAEVTSHNDFPTASGLASSASGFAALAVAAVAAAGLTWPRSALSALAPSPPSRSRSPRPRRLRRRCAW